MRHLSSLLIALALGATAPCAAQTPEAFRSAVAADFSKALHFRVKPFAAQRRIVVSGPVRLHGTGMVTDEGSVFVNVTFNGSAKVSGDNGRVLGGRSFSFMQAIYHYGQPYISQTRRLSLPLALTCDGKPAGSITVTGEIGLRGPRAGDLYILDGSGTLSGEAFLDCGEPQQP
ncbi:MAG: hypothetical protein NTX64_04005 [Elusimicrobia bacterium]|nr:hypothetical protein [Elusimicrobiota bacterium]